MRKIIVGLVAASIVAAPIALAATANADAPPVNGDFSLNLNAKVGGTNEIGKQSSHIIQNGQFVSGQYDDGSGWQNQAGGRAERVQAELAKTGLGRG